jgi:phosphinothricin acetyltransferase
MAWRTVDEVATCDPIHEKAVSRPHAEGFKGEEKRADSFSPESECLVRYSTIGDLPAITAIYSRFVEASTATFEIVPPDQAEMSKRRLAVLNQALPYLVAELEGYVVGFCYASQFRPREGYRYTVEDSIYVRADCIGHGVGKALLSKLISECRARGCHSMIACICGVNVPSVALHASLGFQQAGLLPEAGRKFGEWLRLLILQRPLQSDSMQPAFEHK